LAGILQISSEELAREPTRWYELGNICKPLWSNALLSIIVWRNSKKLFSNNQEANPHGKPRRTSALSVALEDNQGLANAAGARKLSIVVTNVSGKTGKHINLIVVPEILLTQTNTKYAWRALNDVMCRYTTCSYSQKVGMIDRCLVLSGIVIVISNFNIA